MTAHSSREKSPNTARTLLLLTIVWALTRLVAWAHFNPLLSWDIWEARKLHEYGFGNRMGAMLNFHFLPGMLSDPSAFNYVDHPAGAIWIYYVVYSFSGSFGILAFCALAGLAGCLLTHRVLLRFYDERTALWGGLLYVVAPISIFYDANPDLIALGVVFWPLSIFCASEPGLSIRKKAWLLGLIVFIAGQITWFSWMIYPCLLFLTARDDEPFFHQIRRPLSNPVWVGLTIGLGLTMAGFFAQVFGYPHDLTGVFDYAYRRIHPEGANLSRMVMSRTILFKFILLLGPALFLGGIAGMLLTLKQWGNDRLAAVAAIGLAGNLLAISVLTNFYYTELNGHRFALFPASVLTASLLCRVSYRWVKPLVAALCLLGLVYAQFRCSTPNSSSASAIFSQELARRFDPYALVFTNLSEDHSPFPGWEPSPSWNVSLASDRHIYLNTESMRTLENSLARFHSQRVMPPAFYLVDPDQPVDEELRAYFDKHCVRLDDWTLEFPPESPNLAVRLRSFYWRLSKSRFAHKADEKNQSAHRLTLQVFQLPAG